MLDIKPSTPYVLTQSSLQSYEVGIIIILTFHIRKLKPKEISNLPKATQLVNNRTSIQTQVVWLQSPLLTTKNSVCVHVCVCVHKCTCP